MLKLDSAMIQKLRTLPESGMGFQFVRLHRPSGKASDGVAYNAELVLLESEPRSELKGQVFESLLQRATNAGKEFTSVELRASYVLAKQVSEPKAIPDYLHPRDTSGDDHTPAAQAP